MTPDLNQLASSALSIRYFQIVSKESERLQLDTYVIGGYVRDLILCRVSKDADFVTIGDCYPLAEAVAKSLGKESTLNVFKHFGTAQVKYRDWILEFVSARKESYSADSRKPAVESGTLKEDQERRDLTINALAIGLTGKNKGIWLDPFDGLADIEKRSSGHPFNQKRHFLTTLSEC